MGWKPINTKIPELLSRYGLRSCEIIDKSRYMGSGEDKVGKYVVIRRKSKKELPLHVRGEHFSDIVEYYENPAQISYSTLYNRLKGGGKLYPGQINRSVTHKGRKDRYERLPLTADLEDYVFIGKELDHSIYTAMKHYNLARIEKSGKKVMANFY